MRMEKHTISDSLINTYCSWMGQNEKSRATIRKYQYFLEQFQAYAGNREITKNLVLSWKEALKKRFAPVTVNGALAALNGLLRYARWDECTVRLLKICRPVFCRKQREITRQEYEKIVKQAWEEGNERMAVLLQTLCATGIRISELPFITVEALAEHCAEVDCKGKVRKVFLTKDLCRLLEDYAKRKKITSGRIFVTRSGRAMDRSNIWREMKGLARRAGVSPEKVFPHNLRHLFARIYYSLEKDLLRLSDVLGHSNINTTRIYTMESGENHIRQLEKMKLLTTEYNGIFLLL